MILGAEYERDGNDILSIEYKEENIYSISPWTCYNNNNNNNNNNNSMLIKLSISLKC